MTDPSEPPLLRVDDLRVTFTTDAGTITAVDGVSLIVPQGETVALVGESGCGKSVTALSILRLIPDPPGCIESGTILFNESKARSPVDLLRLSDRPLRQIRGNRIALIFQEPMTALHPLFSVGEQITEALQLHEPMSARDARGRAVDLLLRVGIPDPDRRVDDYPHRMSGGMLQRVMIALALSCRPSLLIADEPTTALDVTIQRQILDLLRSLQQQEGMSILLVSHDLGVVAELADTVYVMYAGRIVESASTRELLDHPLHPYTQGLLHCAPRLSLPRQRLPFISGQAPDPLRMPDGCAFHPRCALSARRAHAGAGATHEIGSAEPWIVLRRCVQASSDEPSGQPSLREIRPGHFVSCWEADPSLDLA